MKGHTLASELGCLVAALPAGPWHASAPRPDRPRCDVTSASGALILRNASPALARAIALVPDAADQLSDAEQRIEDAQESAENAKEIQANAEADLREMRDERDEMADRREALYNDIDEALTILHRLSGEARSDTPELDRAINTLTQALRRDDNA